MSPPVAAIFRRRPHFSKEVNRIVPKTILRDLLDHPTDLPLTLAQAANVLGVSASRVVEMVRLGTLEGAVENGERVIGIDRRSVLRYLRL